VAERQRPALRSRPRLVNSGGYLFIGVFVTAALFPFYWMLRTAFTPRSAAFSLHPKLWPEALTFDSFVRALTSPTLPFLLYFRNSVIVSFSTSLLVVLAGAGGAYALARMQFRGQRVFGLSLLIVQMFPPVVLVIPLFVVIAKLRLADTHFGLVLALVTFNLPFVTWMLRGYFLSLPREIEDAARIDGCGRFGVLFRIALPLSAPGVAAAATLAMVNSWNDFLFAFVLINDDAKRVLATGVAAYGQSNNDYTTLFAMATLTTLPVVLLFMLFQRYLVGGLAAGSVRT
jgi:multiple sugar transport system permease protein